MTRAIVLVGGFGTRLRPLTESIPKQMLPILNRPMIEHVLAHLETHGVTEAILSLGYRPDAFREAYPDAHFGSVRLDYAVEPEPRDTAGAIRFAADYAGVDERVIVCNGDVLCDLDITDLVARHEAAGAAATIALHRVEDPSAFGVVPTDETGKVLAFVEKPAKGTEPTDAINAGTYILEPSVIDRIPEGRPVSIERETFPELVSTGEVYAFVSDTYWIDTGTPANFLRAQLDLLDGLRGERGTGVHPEAHIENAQVSRSVVGKDVVVSSGAAVKNSVIMDGATIGANAQITDSIIGPGAIVGDGARVDALSVVGVGAQVVQGEVLHACKRPEEN